MLKVPKNTKKNLNIPHRNPQKKLFEKVPARHQQRKITPAEKQNIQALFLLNEAGPCWWR